VTELRPASTTTCRCRMARRFPREAFAEFTRIDVVFKPDRHMSLEYNIRIRDLRGIMHRLLLTAETAKPGELQMFMPQDFSINVSTMP